MGASTKKKPVSKKRTAKKDPPADPPEDENEPGQESGNENGNGGEPEGAFLMDSDGNAVSMGDMIELLAARGMKVGPMDEEDDEEEDEEGERQRNEPEPDQVRHFFSMIEGLAAHEIGNARCTIDRMEPLYHDGIRTKGYCATMTLPFSLEDIKERFGGGTYKFSLRIDPNERDGMNAPIDRIAVVPIVDPPHPKVGTLNVDLSKQGVQLAPEIQGTIDALRTQVETLASSVPAERPQSLGDRLVERLLEERIEGLFAAPAAPAEPKSAMEILEEHYAMAAMIKKKGGAPSTAVVETEEDDKTKATHYTEEANIITETAVKIFGPGGAWDTIFGERTQRQREIGGEPHPEPQQAEPTTAQPSEQEQAQLKQTVIQATDVIWDCLLNAGKGDHAKTISHKLDQFLQENVSQMWHGMVMDMFTEATVFKWMDETSRGNDHRIRKWASPRTKQKIRKMVKIFRGEES